MPLATDLASAPRIGVARGRDGLWSDDGRSGLVGPENFLRWAATAFMGFAVVVAGWYLAGGESRVDDQVGPVVVAVVGLLVSAGGHASLVRRMRTGLWARREVVLGAIATAWPPPPPAEISPVRAAPAASVGEGSDGVVVAAPDGRFFHRLGCPLIRGKQQVVPLDDRQRNAKEPCGVCRP